MEDNLLAINEREQSAYPETDEEDDWEKGSLFSDASSDATVEEDDSDVVPASFSFATEDHSSDGMSLELPALTEQDCIPVQRVYSSHSEQMCS